MNDSKRGARFKLSARDVGTARRQWFLWRPVGLLIPHRQRVREDEVTEHAVRVVVGDVERGVELQPVGDVAREADRREVIRAALEVDLETPRWIEVVRPAGHRFDPAVNLDRAGGEFVVLGEVTTLQERLRPLASRRPIDEAGGEEIRVLVYETDECPEDLFRG